MKHCIVLSLALLFFLPGCDIGRKNRQEEEKSLLRRGVKFSRDEVAISRTRNQEARQSGIRVAERLQGFKQLDIGEAGQPKPVVVGEIEDKQKAIEDLKKQNETLKAQDDNLNNVERTLYGVQTITGLPPAESTPPPNAPQSEKAKAIKEALGRAGKAVATDQKKGTDVFKTGTADQELGWFGKIKWLMGAWKTALWLGGITVVVIIVLCLLFPNFAIAIKAGINTVGKIFKRIILTIHYWVGKIDDRLEQAQEEAKAKDEMLKRTMKGIQHYKESHKDQKEELNAELEKAHDDMAHNVRKYKVNHLVKNAKR